MYSFKVTKKNGFKTVTTFGDDLHEFKLFLSNKRGYRPIYLAGAEQVDRLNIAWMNGKSLCVIEKGEG